MPKIILEIIIKELNAMIKMPTINQYLDALEKCLGSINMGEIQIREPPIKKRGETLNGTTPSSMNSGALKTAPSNINQYPNKIMADIALNS